MDFATIAGIIVAFGAILAGHVIEGGHVGSILQPTAAVIVLGGTVGAILVQFPAAMLLSTLSSLRHAFVPANHDLGAVVKTIVGLANKARRDGLVAIENEASAIQDSFTRRALDDFVNRLAHMEALAGDERDERVGGGLDVGNCAEIDDHDVVVPAAEADHGGSDYGIGRTMETRRPKVSRHQVDWGLRRRR